MVVPSRDSTAAVASGKFNYGWIIVIVCLITVMVSYGIMYSYSVFFKPLALYFGWNRATLSAVYSTSLILRGAVSIATGWLADRYGPMKLTVFCGLMTGLGLILMGRAVELWQLYVTYGVIEAFGLSGALGIATSLTTRWFTGSRNVGLALGVVSTGSGLGNLIFVLASERMIDAFGWSPAAVILGMFSCILIVSAGLLMRLPHSGSRQSGLAAPSSGMTLKEALRTKKLWVLLGVFFLFIYCLQTLLVHLVNYATDIGISPLVAAGLLSIIGIVSIAARLLVGAGFQKIGSGNSMVLSCTLIAISLVWLLFAHSLWSLYVFAVLFGFAYGAEVPLLPILISQFFGTRAMAALIGVLLFVSNLGGALGPWVGGIIFDSTQSYQWAFAVAAVAAFGSLAMTFPLRRYCPSASRL